MTTSFFMPMKPPTITDQKKRMGVSKEGKPFTYKQQELLEASSMLTAHLAKHVPGCPYSGAVRLMVKWCFPITGKHHNGEYKTSKPDTDNLQKTLKDCMTRLAYWKDDAQVASEIIEKFWAEVPGIYILVEELEEQEEHT